MWPQYQDLTPRSSLRPLQHRSRTLTLRGEPARCVVYPHLMLTGDGCIWKILLQVHCVRSFYRKGCRPEDLTNPLFCIKGNGMT